MKMETGQKHILRKTVTAADTAARYGSGALEVYATPAMIALMEGAAFNLLKECGLDSVGIEINVRHTRACRPGAEVEAEAEVTAIDGKRIHFRITARDGKGEIGNCEHTRYIVDPVKFMERLD